MNDKARYKPISAYGAIGNLRSVALIGNDGSVDWCCFPHMDRGSVFAALLDADVGGRFKVSLRGGGVGEQRYVDDTNVLQTRFTSPGGSFTLTDFMPLGGDIHGCRESEAPPQIWRLIECDRGEVEVEVFWSPRFDYARSKMSLRSHANGWMAEGEGERMTLAGLPEGSISGEGASGPELSGGFVLQSGESRVLVTRWGSENTKSDQGECRRALERTLDIWGEWARREGVVDRREWAGKWSSLVTRSALVLKLLSHADTGAMAAAPTTSLPETIGGVRNWDYRYTWIRDAAMTAQALVSLGHFSEAVDLLYWMERASERSYEEELRFQIMYGLHGEADLKESELHHLEGYRGSRPVRIGNEAAEQFQLEIYGELLNTGYELLRRGQELDDHLRGFLTRVVDHVHDVWRRPDYGIWEVRGPPRHFTYSKVMAWVAFDRGIHLAERFGLQGDTRKWRGARDEVRAEVLERGYDQEVGSFVVAYDKKELDAANLRIPMLELLPFDDHRVRGTIDRTLEELTENGLVYRYHFDDGLPGKEGAFGLCTFWLIDALALSGRVDEARDLFERAAGRASPLGLFSEQIDPESGALLGNFPQAFTHIGLINSALCLGYAEGRKVPEHAPIGTPTHRREMTGRGKEEELRP